jgi:hypothetical protein
VITNYTIESFLDISLRKDERDIKVGMVQWLARLVYTEKVAGSNPAVDSDSNFCASFLSMKPP